MLFSDAHNARHVGRAPVEVDGDDALGAGGDTLGNAFRVHGLRLVDIHKNRPRATGADRLGGGNPGHSGHDDFVSWPDPKSVKEYFNSVGSVGTSDDVLHPQPLGEIRFELVGIPPADEGGF